MNLREFIKLYNFRQIINEKQNTQIIRIYTDWPSEWFEFGVNDWDIYSVSRDERIEKFISKEVLDKEVLSISYDEINEVVSITLEDPEPQKIKNTP